MSLRISDSQASDLPFLSEMLREAARSPEHRDQPLDIALAAPEIARYLDGWGRYGDLAVIATDRTSGKPLGAAWCRLFTAEEPGYGYIDNTTPEITIAVIEPQRGQGIGTALLHALIERAHAAGFSALSLSVSPRNPVAIRLYENAGFERVPSPDDHSVMRLSLPRRE